MTYKFDEKQTESEVIKQLDDVSAKLPSQVRQDITHARQQALRQAAQVSTKQNPIFRLFNQWKIVSPIALAASLFLAISYQTGQEVPPLPINMLVSDIPAEDLNLLEDLEFATWLAEQDVLL